MARSPSKGSFPIIHLAPEIIGLFRVKLAGKRGIDIQLPNGPCEKLTGKMLGEFIGQVRQMVIAGAAAEPMMD